MAPPSYSDIGKQARDVFGKGYHFGLVKLDVKSKTSSGVEFSAGGSSSTDGGKVTGTKFSLVTASETFAVETPSPHNIATCSLDWDLKCKIV